MLGTKQPQVLLTFSVIGMDLRNDARSVVTIAIRWENKSRLRSKFASARATWPSTNEFRRCVEADGLESGWVVGADGTSDDE